MASKLDYLARYQGGGGAAAGSPSTDYRPDAHKKSSKHKSRDYRPASADGLRVVDDDVSLTELAARSRRGGPDIDEREDDAPEVVELLRRDRSEINVGASSSTVDFADVRRNGSSSSSSGPPVKSDASPPRRRRRLDSEDDAVPPPPAPDNSPPRRRRRLDSEDDAPPPAHDAVDNSPPRRRQPQGGNYRPAEGESSPPRRPRGSSSSAAAPSAPPTLAAERVKMASGATSGLHSGQSFRNEQRDLRRADAAALSTVDAAALGAGASTVYRDSAGRAVDVAAEFAKQAAREAAKAAAKVVEKFEWGTGAVQKAQLVADATELAKVSSAPFARRVDDADLESMLKSQRREGDPMAGMLAPPANRSSGTAAAAATSALSAAAATGKPLYSGPEPPPNRFGIRPGYRWDGCDRGNGWEAKIVANRNRKVARGERQYAYATADM